SGPCDDVRSVRGRGAGDSLPPAPRPGFVAAVKEARSARFEVALNRRQVNEKGSSRSAAFQGNGVAEALLEAAKVVFRLKEAGEVVEVSSLDVEQHLSLKALGSLAEPPLLA